MTVLVELDSDASVQEFCRKHEIALVCFSATWCGPCQKAKPALEEMSGRFDDLGFAIVYEHNLKDSIHQKYNVRAFPTYAMFVRETETERVEGVNFPSIEAMIDRARKQKTDGFGLGQGQRLGGTPSSVVPTNSAATVTQSSGDDPMDVDGNGNDAAKEPSRLESLKQEDLDTLTGEMGFSLLRAQKGLLFGPGTVEGAVDWLMQHQDDSDIDDPIDESVLNAPKAKSYKCKESGKILKSMADVELYAAKTGYSDFEECTEEAKSLTPEEKAKKILELKELLKAKRAEREEKEKVDDVEREKQRRFMGKEMAKTREQLEAEQQKRAALKRKKEKADFRKERERIRAELAKDKAERQANKGKLKSKLGVGGYKPDSIQYEDEAVAGGDVAPGNTGQSRTKASAAKIDSYIEKISSYRAGGDGGKCLKVLLAYVGNVVDNPSEEKFRKVKTDNKAFKAKVKPFVGAKNLLVAVGFQPNDDGSFLILKEDADRVLLEQTKEKLRIAFQNF